MIIREEEEAKMRQKISSISQLDQFWFRARATLQKWSSFRSRFALGITRICTSSHLMAYAPGDPTLRHLYGSQPPLPFRMSFLPSPELLVLKEGIWSFSYFSIDIS